MGTNLAFCSFIEKTYVKQDPNLKCVQIFRCPFFPKSDVPPSRGIMWSRAVLHQVRGQLDIFRNSIEEADYRSDIPISDVPPYRYLVTKSSTTSGHLDIYSQM